MAQDDNQIDAPIQWLTPWEYPTRVPNELAEAIATLVARGASLNSALMLHGVSPSRARSWLKWGEEAYRRDAGANDSQAQYLNFFLKMMQAVGLASSMAQHRTYQVDASWWLSHNPEQRSEWGVPVPAALPFVATNDESVEADTPPQQMPTVNNMREVLRTLIESGAATVRTFDERVADGDVGAGDEVDDTGGVSRSDVG